MNKTKNFNFRMIFKPLAWPFLKTPKSGAQTTIMAALDPKFEKISGLYYRWKLFLTAVLMFSQLNNIFIIISFFIVIAQKHKYLKKQKMRP